MSKHSVAAITMAMAIASIKAQSHASELQREKVDANASMNALEHVFDPYGSRKLGAINLISMGKEENK